MGKSISQTMQRSAEPDAKGLIIVGLVFAAIGAVCLAVFFVPMVAGVVRSRNWVATPCVMVSSQVEESPGDDDGGPTYRIAVRYRYIWNDREHVGDRYAWFSVSSSGHSGKRAIADRLRPGTDTTCYVDPTDPAESVLNRDLTSDAWAALIPLVFLVVGGAIVLYGLRSPSATISDAAASAGRSFGRRVRSVSGLANGWTAILPIPDYERGPRELRPVRDSVQSMVFLTVFALLWNAGVGWALSSQLQDAGRRDLLGIVWIVFLVPFALVGLFLVGLVVHQLMARRNPWPTVTLAKSILRLGDSVDLQWKLSGRTDCISVLTLALEGRELATFARGQDDGRTHKHLFAKVEVARVAGPITSATGRATLRVPEKSMPSFQSVHNRIQWVLVVRGEIPYWPDMKEEFTLDIYGPDVKVVLDGPED